jgi:alkylation response protein AidB-like acyl-CoA dehydrogenase
MDFGLSEAQQRLQQTARDLASAQIAPIAGEVDQAARFPGGTVRAMGELGMLGMNVPPAYGGGGAGFVGHALVVEEIARACASHALILSVHSALASWPIAEFGTEAQKRTYLPELAAGRQIGAFALSEACAGSDAAGVQLSAVDDGDSYVLNGSKAWVTNGGHASLFVVFVRTDPADKLWGISALIVERDTPGVIVGPPEQTMGVRAASVVPLSFQDARVPKANLLGDEGEGFEIAMQTLDGGRFNIAAQAVGVAQASLEEASAYASQRQAFDQPIASFQSVRFMLADMATEIQAARWLTLHAAYCRDQNTPAKQYGSMAKLFASRVAVACADRNVQIHGAVGYTAGYPAERHYRDAKVLEIYEGTSQIQRGVIADHLLRKRRR